MNAHPYPYPFTVGDRPAARLPDGPTPLRSAAAALLASALLFAGAAAADGLSERLAALANRFAPGGTLVGSVRMGTLAEGQEKRFGMQLEAGRCYTFLAVGDDSMPDLDMALYADGRRLGDDTEPDNFPVVQACTPERARVEAVLTASRGGGAYMLALHEVPQGGEPAGAADGPARRVREIAQGRSPGATLDGEFTRGRLVEDEVSALSRRLSGGTCYTFAAAAGAGAEDLDLRILVGAQSVGADLGPGTEPVVADFCPARDVGAIVHVSMARGNGEFAFGMFGRPATGPLVDVSEVDTAGLTRRLLREAASSASGMTPARAPEFGSLAHGRSTSLGFATEAGACYRVVGVAEPAIANLDLTLFLDGSPVAEDTDPDATPVVGVCAAATGSARIDVWAAQGAGGFAVGIYSGRAPAGAAAVQAPPAPLETLLEAAAEALAAGATRAAGPYTGALAVAGRQQYDVTLQGGRCYAFVGVCDAGNLDIEVLHGTVVMGRDTDLDATPGVVFCAPSAMTVRAGLTLLSAAGNFAFGVFLAPSVQPEALQPRPTATGISVGGAETDFVANRIRALHEERAAALLPVSAPQRAELGQAQSSEFVLSLPAGRCYTIVAAGVPSVRDLDVTLTSPYGQVLATDTTDDASAVLVTNPCPQWSGDYRIKVTMQHGYGAFGFQVFSR